MNRYEPEDDSAVLAAIDEHWLLARAELIADGNESPTDDQTELQALEIALRNAWRDNGGVLGDWQRNWRRLA